MYQYPGQLIDSEDELNGADDEDNISDRLFAMSESSFVESNLKVKQDAMNPF